MTFPRIPLPAALAFLFAALALSLLAAGAARGQTGFIEALGDVPLMPGLTLEAGRGVTFDAPAGRIVEAVASDRTGKLDAKAVAAFYARSLAQLGWTAAGGNAYKREGEVLRLEFARRKGALEVRFFLKPG